MLLLMTFAALFLTSCVLTMPDPLLKQRNLGKGVIPDISGKWKDDEGSIITITTTSFNNTFKANNKSKNDELTVTLERLDESHYILQVEPAESKGVFLTIAELTPKRINIYTFPESLESIRKTAEKNGVTITENGLIVQYESAKGVVELFKAIAIMQNRDQVVLTKN
jgi:hypothetical protein